MALKGRGLVMQRIGVEVGVGTKVRSRGMWRMLDEEGERIKYGDELGVIVVCRLA